jgi:formiminotetrahydrofolate cyclodeaminase
MLLRMIPESDLSRVTLERFRSEAASPHPLPAGVAVAAVSAGFALGLVAKVLAVIGRRNTLPENTARLEPLAAAAQAASQRMLELAGDDIAAFQAYLTARRLPQSTESERQTRQRCINSAVHRAIDLPLAAAQEAAAGLQLCGEAATFAPPALAADLGVTAGLLASALRGFLLCAQSNVQQLAPEGASSRERVATETKRHAQAFRTADAVLERARTAVDTPVIPGGDP